MGRTPYLGGFSGPSDEDIKYTNDAIKELA